MNKIALFSLMLLTVYIAADDPADHGQVSTTPAAEQTAPPSRMVTLRPAAPMSENGWYLFADALYWHADVGSTEWARKVNHLTFDEDLDQDVAGQPQTGRVHSLNFKWDWGFRLGIGMNMAHDQWDTNFYYTWFRTENSNAVSVTPGVGAILDLSTFFRPKNHSGNTFTSGTNEWKIHYNMFDWELGRWFYVSKLLAFRPHVAIKGGWIHHDVDYSFLDETPQEPPLPVRGTANLKNHFWGIGPSAGVNMLWMFGSLGALQQHRFSLFGDLAAALLYGHFNVGYRSTAVNAITGALQRVGNEHPGGLNRNLAVPVLQTQLGFSWDTRFNGDRNHFTFKIGYELQYWFRQNQLVKYTTNGSGEEQEIPYVGYERVSDDMALQGLTGEFRFDF